jgi:hypothetical protein
LRREILYGNRGIWGLGWEIGKIEEEIENRKKNGDGEIKLREVVRFERG